MRPADLIDKAHAAGIRLGLNGDKITWAAPTGVTDEILDDILDAIKAQKPAIIETLQDSAYWIARVAWAGSKDEVFGILEQFRPLPWADDERARISRVYVRRLGQLADLEDSTAAADWG